MKKQIIYLLLLVGFVGFSQESPVSFSATTNKIKIGEQIEYKITVKSKGTIGFPTFEADSLKKIIDGKDGIVIPAQKLLIVPTFDNTPNFNTSSKEYKEYENNYSDSKITYNASKTDDIPYNETKKYGAEYKYVLKTLCLQNIIL